MKSFIFYDPFVYFSRTLGEKWCFQVTIFILYLQVSLIQSKTECPLMAWPRPPRRIKPLFFTDYNHYIFFFFAFTILHFFSYPGVYFQFIFFFKKYKLKVILPQSAYFKISLICLCTRQLARGFSPFPFKTLGNWSS